MPLYEYRCKQCGHKFEKIQSFSAADETECSKCKGELERLISAPAIQFKGSGWYVNDYAPKSNNAKPAPSESTSSGGEGNSASSEKSVAPTAPPPASAPASSSSKGE